MRLWLPVTFCLVLACTDEVITPAEGAGGVGASGSSSTSGGQGGGGGGATGGGGGATGGGGMESTGAAGPGGSGGSGGAGGSGAGGSGAGGSGPLMVGDLVPDFSLLDVNTASPTSGQVVSPRDYLEQVSGWYFGHAT